MSENTAPLLTETFTVLDQLHAEIVITEFAPCAKYPDIATFLRDITECLSQGLNAIEDTWEGDVNVWDPEVSGPDPDMPSGATHKAAMYDGCMGEDGYWHTNTGDDSLGKAYITVRDSRHVVAPEKFYLVTAITEVGDAYVGGVRLAIYDAPASSLLGLWPDSGCKIALGEWLAVQITDEMELDTDDDHVTSIEKQLAQINEFAVLTVSVRRADMSEIAIFSYEAGGE